MSLPKLDSLKARRLQELVEEIAFSSGEHGYNLRSEALELLLPPDRQEGDVSERAFDLAVARIRAKIGAEKELDRRISEFAPDKLKQIEFVLDIDADNVFVRPERESTEQLRSLLNYLHIQADGNMRITDTANADKLRHAIGDIPLSPRIIKAFKAFPAENIHMQNDMFNFSLPASAVAEVKQIMAIVRLIGGDFEIAKDNLGYQVSMHMHPDMQEVIESWTAGKSAADAVKTPAAGRSSAKVPRETRGGHSAPPRGGRS